MALVRLQQDWTDPDGTAHPAGSTADVDEATVDELRAAGIAYPTGGGWPGPSGEPDGGAWAGPSGGDD